LQEIAECFRTFDPWFIRTFSFWDDFIRLHSSKLKFKTSKTVEDKQPQKSSIQQIYFKM